MRVLVLESSPAIQKVVRLALVGDKTSQIQTLNGLNALKDLPEEHRAESIVVVSESADKGGLENELAELKELLPCSRCLILVNSSEHQSEVKKHGFPHVLAKPFQLNDFRHVFQLCREENSDELSHQDTFPVEQEPPPLEPLESFQPAMSVNDIESAFRETLQVAKVTDSQVLPMKLPSGRASPMVTTSSLALQTRQSHVAEKSGLAKSDEALIGKPPDGLPAKFPETPDQSRKIFDLAPESLSRSSLSATVAEEVQAILKKDVQAHVDGYLNQNWQTILKSLSSQVSKNLEKEHLAQIQNNMQQMQKRTMRELRSELRREIRDALQNWMGNYSREVLKEVAREELSKLIDSV